MINTNQETELKLSEDGASEITTEISQHTPVKLKRKAMLYILIGLCLAGISVFYLVTDFDTNNMMGAMVLIFLGIVLIINGCRKVKNLKI